MKFLTRYMRIFVKWALAASLLAPALVWAHGAVDIPISRQVFCYKDPGFWSNPNDPGCKALNAVSGTYPGQQWNEVAKLVSNYESQSAIEQAVPDGTLCAAGDPKKAGLNLAQSVWHKTPVIPVNGIMKVRLIGTAPHVPSFVRIYLSKPGFNAATTALKWSDLELVHSERMTEARKGAMDPPGAISGTSGYFEFQVNVPAGRKGDAVLFTRWQREDPAGEGFYNCSDITLGGAGEPAPWPDLGRFISEAIPPAVKVGDMMHFRVLGDSKSASELVDIKLQITASNLNANIWGKQIADKVDSAIAKIGKRQGSNVVFDPNDSTANNVFVVSDGYTFALSIIPGGGETPVNPTPPTARISGPDAVKSGETIELNGSGSTGYNGPLSYKWTVSGIAGADTAASFRGVAPNVANPTQSIARLTVTDKDNNKTAYVDHRFVISPAGDGGGGDFPAYVPNKTPPYKPGEEVSNKGSNYQCKPFPASGWCSQSPPHYEPGVGSHWQDAWDKL